MNGKHGFRKMKTYEYNIVALSLSMRRKSEKRRKSETAPSIPLPSPSPSLPPPSLLLPSLSSLRVMWRDERFKEAASTGDHQSTYECKDESSSDFLGNEVGFRERIGFTGRIDDETGSV
ncbi:hypothetical protein LOK49_LG07G03441 [Camellia lanceoleosa]|uniref:Uncharacterized protein n=1 Tax=Camellia lanceoleosa TaxID=1840588 RepID=A0ACC0GZA7_9ERIC|nr:hypothetical protein LOK49_LG07G03441 [Camellia lanceoleosa]